MISKDASRFFGAHVRDTIFSWLLLNKGGARGRDFTCEPFELKSNFRRVLGILTHKVTEFVIMIFRILTHLTLLVF